MGRVVVVHGWSGGPDSDWHPWLKIELEKMGHKVLVPEMPDSDAPVIEKQVGHLAKIVGTPDKETFFVGHSIGCQTILRYLDMHQFKPLERVGGAVFVAGWFGLENLEDDETRAIAEPWIKTPINLKKVKTVLLKSTLIISDNDPYNAFEKNKRKFGELGSKIVVLHDAGHMTGEDGFVEFPKVLSGIRGLMSA